ncbi:hypothetical protein FOZ63_011551 [Perkinsus olseni]|uniref:Peptidase A1 domain-containing protein n=1 Tax=Perkinsus olseni TaxID=32597 RepID=A0A7J6TAD9_PEROL|nr:hypothetical protein FOZ63_011551 [Perkinsus olseni]
MVGMTFADTTFDIQPYATLGLSFASLSERAAGAREPFLEQLMRSMHPIVSIYVSKLYLGITGKLVLGESPEQLEGATFFRLRDAPQVAGVTNAIYVSAVWVKDPYADDHTIKLDGKSLIWSDYTVVIDAGAGVTIVPKEVFSMIWEAIEDKFGADRVDRTGKARSPTDPNLAAYVNDDGEICSRRHLVKDLPALV